MLFSVHDQTIINLVRENNQFMATSDLHDLLQQLTGIQRAGGVIGIDNNDCLGLGRDLALNIRKVRIPIGGFVANIMHRFAACQIGTSRPQRIIGTGDQHLVTGIEQCVQ